MDSATKPSEPPDASQARAEAGLPRAAGRLRRLGSALRVGPALLVALGMALTTFLVYWPYRTRTAELVRYWDGPLYVYIAKTLYDVPAEHPFLEYGLTPAYFACHLPLYPLLIRLLSLATLGNYPAAMLLATTYSAVVAALLFHRLLVRKGLVQAPLYTALLFAVLPPRWIIYHAVGATEPLFLCCVFGAFLAHHERRFGLAALAIALASLTRITGVLLLPALLLPALLARRFREVLILSLGGLGVLALLGFHWLHFGDPLAYFRWNLDKVGLLAHEPLAVFRAFARSDDFQATEYYAGLYLVYGLGTLALWRQREIFLYSALTLALNCFVYHLDVGRYFLTAAPFALLVGYDAVLARPACRWLLPLAAYLGLYYAWGYLPHNLVDEQSYGELLRALGAPPQAPP